MKSISLTFLIILCLASCKSGDKAAKTVQGPAQDTIPKTEVAVAHPSDTLRLTEPVTLNATATYLLKSDVKANTTGYITRMSIRPADHVNRGQALFTLETKEARALGNTINNLDASFRFHGTTTVVSPTTGFVAMLNHQIGDYVQEGEVLATITDASSFGFVADVPFEYLQLIKSQKELPIKLSDGQTLWGKIAKIMPTADPTSQTVRILVKTASANIPENLIGNISFSKQTATGLSVPRMAVVSDETQTNFWVMKVVNGNTAVKVPITKGLETDQNIQVTSGNLSPEDWVITSGNFGLENNSKVKVVNQ